MEIFRCAFHQLADASVVLRLQTGDRASQILLKLSIDPRVYAADVVDFVGEMLLSKNPPHTVAPPVCALLTRVPKKITIDHSNGVEEF